MALALTLGIAVLAGCGGTERGPAAGSGADEGLLVTLTTNPSEPETGRVEFVVEVKDADNQAVPGATVNLKADMIGHSMGDLSGQATDQGNGRYATAANLSMAGQWKVDVQVQTADKDVQREFRINVK
jgi:nitrogen fixation protein FixH